MRLRAVTIDDLDRLAALNAASFETAWDSKALAMTLGAAGVRAWAIVGEADLDGFLIARVAADEAEILTVAVDPERRRRGVGSTLVRAALAEAEAQGASAAFLEVATDNPGALALYERLGFVAVGKRRGYYGRRRGPRVDAVVLRRDLTP